MSINESNPEETSPKWQPLATTERRVFGVLVEKAKTTPDAYPLTINSITTGSNQKSNRSPLMKLEPIDVENALESLRRVGAVSEVHGHGRMPKYRHRVYEWLGVDKVEAAVMTELLLRGEQTLGELRGRAARMEKIADVASLRPVVASLIAKGLVQALTPEGRGQIVTHCLYLPEQQDKLKRVHGDGEFGLSDDLMVEPPVMTETAGQAAPPNTERSASSQYGPSNHGMEAKFKALEEEIENLKDYVSNLEKRLETMEQLIN